MRHIEKTGIVRTDYSDIFQVFSGIFTDIPS